MSVNVSIGHTVNMSISYLDQNGNPMLTPPTPDSPPTWADTNSAAATLTVSGDGMTAADAAVAVGVDTVNLTVVVGGQSFSASLDVNVQAAPQVLTSVAIASTVS